MQAAIHADLLTPAAAARSTSRACSSPVRFTESFITLVPPQKSNRVVVVVVPHAKSYTVETSAPLTIEQAEIVNVTVLVWLVAI